MGVAGLWDVLRPAANVRSLTDLAIKEGFEANADGKRGFRLGIDASIWFFHAEYGREGENPVLRTLFFRCATLMHTTFLPIFVFDGPKRPDVKRGKKINRTSHKLIPGMKQIVEAFGFEWRMAPGEAEAELAYMNRIGVIDGILSDDVDNFLFGATTVIRNSSNTLSGNRANPILNSAGKDDKNHSRIFQLHDIKNHPDIRLTRGGMILIGLMSGGDYQQGGLMRCGVTTAHGLAKCGFGDSLYDAAVNLDREELEVFLINWRHELRQELRSNSKKEIGRKQVALANSIPEDFPDIDVLLSYVRPITSESMGRESNNLKLTWAKEPDLAKLAGVCEFYFEWGYKESIIKRFRTVMWHSIVLRILRRAVLDLDERASKKNTPATPRKKGRENERPQCGTPSKVITQHFSSLGISTPGRVCIPDSEDEDGENEERLILKIHSSRTHTSTDGLPEYRLEIAPKQLVRLTESGIQGIRVPEGPDEWASDDGDDDEGDGKKRGTKEPVDPETHLRLWMPACMVKLVEPALVQEYEDLQEQKLQKKIKKGARATETKTTKEKALARKKKAASLECGEDVFSAAPAEKSKGKSSTANRKAIIVSPLHDEEEESDSGQQLPPTEIYPPPFDGKLTTKAFTSGATVSRMSPSEEEDELYEYDLLHSTTQLSKPSRSSEEATSLNAVRDVFPQSISSPIKPRTGIRDLTKKKATTSSTVDGLKSFFPVTHSATAAKKPAIAGAYKLTTHSKAGSLLETAPYKSSKAGSSTSSSSSMPKKCTTASSKLAKAGSSKAMCDSESSGGEYSIALWDRKGKANPTVSPMSKRKILEKSTSSPSESDHHRLEKSPRKKAGHTSPKSSRRPSSPSPSSSRLMTKKFNEVINISDFDSDDSLPSSILPAKKKLPPLMLARARAATSTSSQIKTKKPVHTYSISPEIIDLT